MQQWIYLFTLFTMTLLSGLTPLSAQASIPADCRILADGQAYRLERPVQLIQAIPETASQPDEMGVFHAHIVRLRFKEGQRVLLSGSAEGAGFRTDDQINLLVTPRNAEKIWNFQSSDGMRILTAERPDDITDMFAPGYNHVGFEAVDILGPLHSSSAYWLLFFDPCTASDTAAAATATPTSAASLSPGTVPNVPTATLEATATPNPTAVPPVATTQPAADTSTDVVNDTQQPATSISQSYGRTLSRFLSWRFLLGIPFAILLVGAGFWQQPSMQARIRNYWKDVRTWLESLR